VSSNEHKVRFFAIGCAGFLMFGLINFSLFPDFTKEFIFQAMERTTETWYNNPSSFALIKYLLINGFGHFDVEPSSVSVKLIYFGFATSIIWVSWGTLCAVKSLNEKDQYTRLFLIFFSILVYTLAMPRMKDYAYMLAIPSILFAVERFEIKVPRW